MMEPEKLKKTGDDSVKASDASLVPKPTAKSAAAPEVTKAPRVPINPDDLPDLFAGSLSGDPLDDEDPLVQMRNNPNYAALIKDLEAIVQAAKELFSPAEETPSDELWGKIAKQLPTKPEAM
jgi:hypothetical protein